LGAKVIHNATENGAFTKMSDAVDGTREEAFLGTFSADGQVGSIGKIQERFQIQTTHEVTA